MFVAEEQMLDISADAARLRLANLVSSGLLDSASKATYLQQGAALLAVGPFRGISRLVRVQLRSPVTHGDTTLVALRWEAAGTGGSLFPALDADLSVRPAGGECAMLRLDGTYRPPLGALGAGLDRAVLHLVAASTARAFIRQVAGALTSPAPAAAPGAITGLPAEPAAPTNRPDC